MRYPYMKFQNPSMHCFWRTDNLKPICPVNFFKVRGIMTEVTRCFCWHQNFDPKGLSAADPGPYGIYMHKAWKKNMYKIRVQSYLLWKLATNGQSDMAFLLTSKCCPQGGCLPLSWSWSWVYDFVHHIRAQPTLYEGNLGEIVRHQSVVVHTLQTSSCIKSLKKRCIKSDFKEIFIKLVAI